MKACTLSEKSLFGCGYLVLLLLCLVVIVCLVFTFAAKAAQRFAGLVV